MLVTLDVCQLDKSPLNAAAELNIDAMLPAIPVFQLLMSPLNPRLLWKVLWKLFTLDTSHPLISPLKLDDWNMDAILTTFWKGTRDERSYRSRANKPPANLPTHSSLFNIHCTVSYG